MKLDIEELEFDALLRLALQEWPRSIELNLVYTNTGSVNERYSVDGLGDMEEAISIRFIDTPNEVLMRNLHWAIFQTIHALAKFCTKVEIDYLRNKEVRVRFEQLLESAKATESDWSLDDKNLINNYFLVNKKE